MPQMPFPPQVPGVSQGGQPPPNPMEMLAKMFQSRPGNAMMALTKALSALREAGQADPRLEPIVGEAIRVLTQGINGKDRGERFSGGGDTGIIGPSPGSIMNVRSSPE